MDLASADVPLSDQQDSVTPLKLPRAFLHDCARCLALAHQHRLQLLPGDAVDLSAWPSPFILPTLTQDAQCEEQSPAFSFILRLLQAAELLHADAECWRVDTSMATWLGQPSATQLLHLRRAWWEHILWDARALPALRLPPWLERRWPAIVAAVCAAVVAGPTAVWTPLTDLRPELERAGLLAAPGVTANLPALRDVAASGVWNLARFLIHVALPRLGLLELANVAGQPHLRPTEEGRAWLRTALARHTAAEEAAGAGPSAPALEVDVPYQDLCLSPPDFPLLTATLPVDPANTAEITLDLRLSVTAPAACTFVLMHVAEPLPAEESAPAGIPATVMYRATHATIARGIARGYPVSTVLFLLARWTGGELDSKVVHHPARRRTPLPPRPHRRRRTADRMTSPNLYSPLSPLSSYRNVAF